MKKTIPLIVTVITFCLIAVLILPACNNAGKSGNYDYNYISPGLNAIYKDDISQEAENYVYDSVKEQAFVSTDKEATSYFSLDKNTANYSLVRNQINNGYKPSPDSIRIEELVNYFDYPLSAPEPDNAIGVSVSLMDCPWNSVHKLMMLGVKTNEISIEGTNGNYVFLIDRSGSMSGSNRIELAKKGMIALADGLGGGDVVSLVTYASGTELVVDGAECVGEQRENLKAKINALSAYGSTNGQGGLTLAYETARKHFINGGNNRVILISDGDFNVGMSSTDAMKEFIQEQAKSGIYLSVFGVGMGNTRDDMLETLARNGNGTYAYLDNEKETTKAFTDGLAGMLFTVAKDAKASVTFDSEKVDSYRLIGYDTKILTQSEYENDATDAGEIGSGLCVIVLYEIALKAEASGEIATAEIKYKDVRGESEVSSTVTATISTATETTLSERFAACVAEFGLVLRQSEYKGNASLAHVKESLENIGEFYYGDEAKSEFYELVCKAMEGAAA